MPVQDNLQFYQELLAHFYRLTLENGVYATCLALTVWFLTSVLYSISINSLNKRNRISLKATIDAENALLAAQEHVRVLEGELEVSKTAVEQEMRRGTELQDRMNEIAARLTESILALAAEADLGQQGLSVKEGLQAEQLWQRYSGAVNQLIENLLAEKKSNGELKQACSLESSKVADRDMQLQVAQIRADGLKQQIAKLELLVEEHKAQLEQQQESAKLRLAALESRHQADLSKVASSEKPADRSVSMQSARENQENLPIGPQAAELAKHEESAWSVTSTTKTESAEQATARQSSLEEGSNKEHTVSFDYSTEQKSATSTGLAGLGGKLKGLMGSSKKTVKEPVRKDDSRNGDAGESSGVSPVEPINPSYSADVAPAAKSKSIFGGFRERVNKLDKMLGQETPVISEQETERYARTDEQPRAVNKAAVSAREYESDISEILPVEPKKPLKSAAVGATPKSKSMFAGFRERIDKLDKMLGQETPVISEEETERSARTDEQPRSSSKNVDFSVSGGEAAVEATNEDAKIGLGGKFKSMFGGSKKTVSEGVIADATAAESQSQPVVESPRAKKGGITKLFGKFKK